MINLIEDRYCDVCGTFNESIGVTMVNIGVYLFNCPHCGEENVYFTNNFDTNDIYMEDY